MPITKERQEQVDKWRDEMIRNQREKAAKDHNRYNDPAPRKEPTAK